MRRVGEGDDIVQVKSILAPCTRSHEKELCNLVKDVKQAELKGLTKE